MLRIYERKTLHEEFEFLRKYFDIPTLTTLKVVIVPELGGMYSLPEEVITIKTDLNICQKSSLYILLHEICHAIQKKKANWMNINGK